MNRQQLIDIKLGDILGVVNEGDDNMQPELVIVIDLYEPQSQYYLEEWEVRSYSDKEDTFWVDTNRIRFTGTRFLDRMVEI